MARKRGKYPRYGKLGLFYNERPSDADYSLIGGLLTGWPSETWDHNSGDPLFYEFYLVKRPRKRAVFDFRVWRNDGVPMQLEEGDRLDLGKRLEWQYSPYWLNHDGLTDIPVAKEIKYVARLARLALLIEGRIPWSLGGDWKREAQRLIDTYGSDAS